MCSRHGLGVNNCRRAVTRCNRLGGGLGPHTDRLGITAAGLRDGAYRIASGPDWLLLLGKDFDPIMRAQYGEDFAKSWDKPEGAPAGFWNQDEGGSLNAVYGLLHRLGVRWFMPGEIGEVVPFEVNPDGVLAEGNPGPRWKSLAEVKTERGSDSWRVHVHIPVVGPAEAEADPHHRVAGLRPTAQDPW